MCCYQGKLSSTSSLKSSESSDCSPEPKKQLLPKFVQDGMVIDVTLFGMMNSFGEEQLKYPVHSIGIIFQQFFIQLHVILLFLLSMELDCDDFFHMIF